MLKNRIELAKHFSNLGFKYGAEVGACYGRYSEILCRSIPGLKLIAIDNWNNAIDSQRRERAQISGEESTRLKLAPYDAVVVKKNSMDAVKDVEDGSLDFVFIDASHKYEDVKDDIREWSKKVRKGGIVSGHDYYVFPRSGNRGVVDAVDEYVKENQIELFIIERDDNNPVRDDRNPCWYYVKK